MKADITNQILIIILVKFVKKKTEKVDDHGEQSRLACWVEKSMVKVTISGGRTILYQVTVW